MATKDLASSKSSTPEDTRLIKEMMKAVKDIPFFYAEVCSAPSIGSFSNLHTTLKLKNVRKCEVWDLWNEEIVTGGTSHVQQALLRLVKLVKSGAQQLSCELEQSSNERVQLLTIINHVLMPLTGQPVVVNKQEFRKELVVPPTTRQFLGIGMNSTWHGAPDARCDVDIVDVDTLQVEDSESELSSGAKTNLEIKTFHLNTRARNQLIGNVVTSSFVHNNRHPSKNPLVPVVGLSGSHGTLMVALYECTKDILIYCNPCEWLTHHQQFRYMGLMLLWLALHHSLFVKKVQVEEPVSGLHQRFQRDGVFETYLAIKGTHRASWPSTELDYFISSPEAEDRSPPSKRKKKSENASPPSKEKKTEK